MTLNEAIHFKKTIRTLTRGKKWLKQIVQESFSLVASIQKQMKKPLKQYLANMDE